MEYDLFSSVSTFEAGVPKYLGYALEEYREKYQPVETFMMEQNCISKLQQP